MTFFGNAVRALAPAAAGLWLASCASVMSGTDQALTVITEPAGAACELTRDGAKLGYVNPTPASITIQKGWDDIIVTCRKEGYEDTAATVASTHDAWSSAGNVLVWGIFFPVAMAVDAGSGAMNEYPPTVVIRLIQRSFATALERDRFYDGATRSVRDAAAAKIAATKKNCKQQDGCAEEIQKLEAARDAELARLEEKRQRAVIGPGTAAAPTVESAPPAVAAPPSDAYAAERQKVESKWAARIDGIRQFHCQGEAAGSADCAETVRAAEGQRDLELAALAERYKITASN
jgi:hypothetical protein